MQFLLWISEPETGLPGQGDAEAFGAVYKYRPCCTRLKISSLLCISEPEPGVPGRRDAGAVVAGFKSHLC
jgi:hypothetical protein